MFKLLLGLFFSISAILFSPSFVAAISDPQLTSPTNNAILNSSPSFSWQAIPEATRYRILIDNEPLFHTPYTRSEYPTANHYTPLLNPGTYYWKVEAQDSFNNWSAWSETWSFTYEDPQPSPSPSPTPSPTPEPTPTPTPSESPSPSPSPSLSPTPDPTPTPLPSESPLPSPSPSPTITPKPEHENEHPKKHWTCRLEHHRFKIRSLNFQIPLPSCGTKGDEDQREKDDD